MRAVRSHRLSLLTCISISNFRCYWNIYWLSRLKYSKHLPFICTFQVYGFYDECLRKYGSVNVWRYCTDIFDYLRFANILLRTQDTYLLECKEGVRMMEWYAGDIRTVWPVRQLLCVLSNHPAFSFMVRNCDP
jgi:hypothetical protein